MPLLDKLIAIGGAPAPTTPRSKRSTTPKPTPSIPHADVRYWIPVAVELHTSRLHCQCGAEHPASPRLFVREVYGEHSRLRGIDRPGQFTLLPRIMVHDPEPTWIQACPDCFVPELRSSQLAFMWPEEQEVFKQAVIAGMEAAFVAEQWESAVRAYQRNSHDSRAIAILPKHVRENLDTIRNLLQGAGVVA